MALLVDAGALYAQADADEPRHTSVVQLLKAERGALVTTELVVAEADYLILDRLGIDVELAFVDDLAHGTFMVECLSRAELTKAHSVVERTASAVDHAYPGDGPRYVGSRSSRRSPGVEGT